MRVTPIKFPQIADRLSVCFIRMNTELSDVQCLTAAQRKALAKGHIVMLTQLLHASPEDLASKTGLTYNEVAQIIGNVAAELAPVPATLSSLSASATQMISTGDETLDNVLGGGVSPGLVWEFAGESGSGKTQLAIQLALTAQLSSRMGGVSGSCCYMTPGNRLPTLRLQQLLECHPLLRGQPCSLDNINVRRTDDIPALLQALEELEALIRISQDKMPLKLLIVDNFTTLFRGDETTTNSLADRSRDISDVAVLFHQLAVEHNLAVIVINESVDVFVRDGVSAPPAKLDEPLYRDAAPWFSTASSVPGENAREPALGLAWANQLNVRVMFSKTGRRRVLDVPMSLAKRQRIARDTGRALEDVHASDDPILVRRMSVIFSSLSATLSVDYIITDEGVSSLGAPYEASY